MFKIDLQWLLIASMILNTTSIGLVGFLVYTL